MTYKVTWRILWKEERGKSNFIHCSRDKIKCVVFNHPWMNRLARRRDTRIYQKYILDANINISQQQLTRF